MASFWESFGFRANPFANYNAEKEPDLDQYLVRPAYFQALAERTERIESFLLFGARGSGKSATRIALYKAAMARVAAGTHKCPLPITLDSYSAVLAGGLDRVTAGGLVGELGYLTCEAVLVWLAALDESDRGAFMKAMDGEEEQLAVWMLKQFYFSRSDAFRQVSNRRALELIDQAWHKRPQLWIQKKWNAVAAVIGAIADALVSKATGASGGVAAPVASVLTTSPDELTAAREILAKMVDFVRIFGFSGVLVLIDKVDETDLTNDSADSTARVLFPLLANTGLLEVPGVGFMSFLWDRVREVYAGKRPVRLDKIPNAEINWNDEFLVELVRRRLAYFSNKSITSFDQICAPGIDSGASVREMIRCSMYSPRELIRLLDTVVREHEEKQRTAVMPKLDDRAITAGIDRYCVDRVFSTYPKQTLAQIYRLGMNEFVNKDVQSASRIGAASARNRVRNWCDAGFVAPRGNRLEGRVGKPATEYTITDQRLRRVIERKLWPENQLDLSLDPPEPMSEPDENAESD